MIPVYCVQSLETSKVVEMLQDKIMTFDVWLFTIIFNQQGIKTIKIGLLLFIYLFLFLQGLINAFFFLTEAGSNA